MKLQEQFHEKSCWICTYFLKLKRGLWRMLFLDLSAASSNNIFHPSATCSKEFLLISSISEIIKSEAVTWSPSLSFQTLLNIKCVYSRFRTLIAMDFSWKNVGCTVHMLLISATFNTWFKLPTVPRYIGASDSKSFVTQIFLSRSLRWGRPLLVWCRFRIEIKCKRMLQIRVKSGVNCRTLFFPRSFTAICSG